MADRCHEDTLLVSGEVRGVGAATLPLVSSIWESRLESSEWGAGEMPGAGGLDPRKEDKFRQSQKAALPSKDSGSWQGCGWEC